MHSPIRQWRSTWKPPVVAPMTSGNLTVCIYASPPSWFPPTVYICLHGARNRKSTRLHVRAFFFYAACALIYIYDHNYRFKNEKQTGQGSAEFWVISHSSLKATKKDMKPEALFNNTVLISSGNMTNLIIHTTPVCPHVQYGNLVNKLKHISLS